MNLEPERERLQPSLEPRRSVERIEQPAASQPAAATAGPAAAPPPAPAKPLVTRFQKFVRVISVVLLLAAAGLIVGGADPKPNVPPPPAAVASQAESVPNEIVVDLRDNVTEAEIAQLQQQFGIVLRYNSPLSAKSKLMVGTVDPERRDSVIQAMRAHPLVEAVDRQYIYRLQNKNVVPNDPYYQYQWHLKMIGMEEAWAITKGAGASVAVIDSGVGMMQGRDYVRPQDFATTKFRQGYDWVDHDDMPADENHHGTHVAGTIAEATDNGVLGAGVAPEAEIMPLRIADANGGARTSDFAEALQYLSQHPTNVANMSMGSPVPDQVLEKAIKEAYDKNVTLVCSSGNDGHDRISYPAAYKECISVGAVGPSGQVAPYSNWGAGLDIAGPGGDQRQRAEDGVCQNTFRATRPGMPGPKQDGFFCLQGTSMASPHVAGVAALLASQGVKDPKQIRSILRKTAKGGQPQANADHYGAGVLDAAKAVESVSRNTSADYFRYGLSAAGLLIAIVLGRNLRQPTDPMFFAHKVAIAIAAGTLSPLLIEKLAGFGSLWNLVGHSVLLALLFLWAPPVDRSGLWQAGGFALGLMIHLGFDADSLSVPLQVFPIWRIQFWLFANLAVGLMFLIAAIASRRKALAPGAYA